MNDLIKFMDAIEKVTKWILGDQDQRSGIERRVKVSRRKKTNKRKTQRRK